MLQVIAKLGVKKATVRAIAKEGGFTSGLLSHYFGSKEEMIDFAFAAVAEAAFQRIEKRSAKATTPLERIRIAMEEMLPTRAGSPDALVPISFWGEAAHSRSLQAHFQQQYSAWRDHLRRPFEAAREAGELKASAHIDDEVRQIIAMSDGLLISWTLDPSSFSKQIRSRLIDAYMTELERRVWQP